MDAGGEQRMRKSKDVWEAARLEYITSECSQRDIAEKYEISETAVKNRALKEQWLKEREKYKRKLTAEVTKKLAEKQAKKFIQLSAGAENLAKVANKKSRAILNAAKAAEKAGDPVAWRGIKAKEILQLAETTKKLTETMILIHGKPQNDTDDNTIRVILGGDAEEYAK